MTDYITGDDLKAYLKITGNSEDDLLDQAATDASRMAEEYCGRIFTLDSVATQRTYRLTSPMVIRTDDIGDASGIIVETSYDLAGWDAVATVAYHPEPFNALTQGGEPRPFTEIRSNDAWRAIPVFFGAYVRVTAKHGWPVVPAAIPRGCKLLAARMWKRGDSPTGIETFTDFSRRIISADPDVTNAFSTYVRHDRVDSFA